MDDILCRRGDKCRFVATIGDGTLALDARYDRARFWVRETLNTTDVLIQVDETSGVLIDHAASKVTVELGATKTETIPLPLPRNAVSQLRLYNSSDPDDRISWLIGFVILPSVIDDE